MSKPDFHYVEPQANKLEDLGKQSCGFRSVYTTLLNTQLSNTVADEQHQLMLRITDVMLKNLISDVKESDTREEYAEMQNNGQHLSKLVQAINRWW